MRRTLDREISQLRGAGIRVLRLEPTADDLAVMGPNFMDGTQRLRVLEHTLRSARRNLRAAMATFSTADRRPRTADRARACA